MIQSRPGTLAEIASRTLQGCVFRMELADFLDAFYAEPSEGALSEAPQRLAGKIDGGHEKDVYLAAVAEHLGRHYRLPIGEWAFDKGLFMKKPVFAYRGRGGRIFLLRESPPAFKARNLFVTANALTRV